MEQPKLKHPYTNEDLENYIEQVNEWLDKTIQVTEERSKREDLFWKNFYNGKLTSGNITEIFISPLKVVYKKIE